MGASTRAPYPNLGTGLVERDKQKATKMTWREQLEELEIFSLENRRLRRDLPGIFKYINGCYKEVCDVHRELTAGDRQKVLNCSKGN